MLDDDLSPDERAALHASLDRALDDSEAGRGMSATEYVRLYALVVKAVLLDEAQRRFEAEDEWWREHRDAKESFVQEFGQMLEQLSSVPGRGQRYGTLLPRKISSTISSICSDSTATRPPEIATRAVQSPAGVRLWTVIRRSRCETMM